MELFVTEVCSFFEYYYILQNRLVLSIDNVNICKRYSYVFRKRYKLAAVTS